MVNFIIIFISFFIGYISRFSERFPANTAAAINQFIIFISLPSLIASKVPRLLSEVSLQGSWWLAVSMPWILFLTSWIVVGQIGKHRRWSSAKTGALILTAGLGNTSFVGFPLLEATLGPSAIPYGVLIDQLGSFLILASLGVFVAALYSGTSLSFQPIVNRLFTFPPFLSLVLSLVWFFIDLPGKKVLLPVFDRLALTLVPLALFSVGFQTYFGWGAIRRRLNPLIFGITFKMFLMPSFFYILYFQFLGKNDLLTQTTLLESAMATQITSAVVVADYKLDTELANLMVSLSIPLSLITIPLIHHFIL